MKRTLFVKHRRSILFCFHCFIEDNLDQLVCFKLLIHLPVFKINRFNILSSSNNKHSNKSNMKTKYKYSTYFSKITFFLKVQKFIQYQMFEFLKHKKYSLGKTNWNPPCLSNNFFYNSVVFKSDFRKFINEIKRPI